MHRAGLRRPRDHREPARQRPARPAATVPPHLERLRAEPALIEPAVEELLRFDSPAQFISRTARVDFEWRGAAPCARGDVVLAALGAANRDPAAFVAADQPRPRAHARTRTWPSASARTSARARNSAASRRAPQSRRCCIVSRTCAWPVRPCAARPRSCAVSSICPSPPRSPGISDHQDVSRIMSLWAALRSGCRLLQPLPGRVEPSTFRRRRSAGKHAGRCSTLLNHTAGASAPPCAGESATGPLQAPACGICLCSI